MTHADYSELVKRLSDEDDVIRGCGCCTNGRDAAAAILALTKMVTELKEALKPLLNEKAIARLKELLEVERAMGGHRMVAIYELILNREDRARLALSGKGV